MLHQPALLSIGPASECRAHIISFLQKQLCPHQTTPCNCTVCRSVQQEQSTAATWIAPRGSDYVRDDLAPLFEAIRFRLNEQESHFVIIQEAHLLTPTTANALLKSIEEPPSGYQFILCTHHPSALLPTIQSRTTVWYQCALSAPELSPLTHFFTSPEKLVDPQAFEAALKSENPTATQAKEVLDQLVAFGDFSAFENQDAIRAILHRAQKNPPQQASGGMFLRWLFLAFHAQCHG
jgi:DNA polymerase III gamma/tau subunit